MLCPYCQMTREDNGAPCAYCGGAAPWSNGLRTDAWNGASMPQMPPMSLPPSTPWGGPGMQSGFQQSPDMSAPAPMPNPQSWAGNTFGASPQENAAAQEQEVSLLPVPYQGSMRGWMQQVSMGHVEQQGASMQLVPYTAVEATQQVGPLLPGVGDAEEPSIVYVPPMYTKLRPIIPRYRIISGFLSVLIVSLLVCSGAGYYAQSSGKLDAAFRFFTGAPPASMRRTSAADLPDPPQKVDLGPAYGVIPSAIVTSHVDPNNKYFAVQADTVFKVGQIFYVIYSVQNPKTSGVVTIKWYTNNSFYKDETSTTLAANPDGIYYGKSPMQYAQAAEGIVELYWNNQLAQRLYFVVR